MAAVTVPTYTGDIPDRSQDQSTFDTNVQDFLDYFAGSQTTDVIPKINAAGTQISSDSASAASSEANALLYQSGAQAAAAQAASSANADLWLVGTTYAEGDTVIDDIDYQAYRSTTAGNIGTQPSTDTTGDWILITFGALNPNLIINPNFIVNQEAYTSGVITTGEYGHDMWKSISSASYTISSEALTMVSGTLGQRNDELADAHGEVVTISVESGSLTVGATGGAVSTVVTSSNPYTFTLDMDLATDFITITAATAAKGIKLERGYSATKYSKPEPTNELVRCFFYFQKIESRYVGPFFGNKVVGGSTYELYMPISYAIKSTATVTGLTAYSVFDSSGTESSFTIDTDNLTDFGYYASITTSGLTGQLINFAAAGASTNYIELDARP